MLEREEQVVTVLRLADEILQNRFKAGDCFVVTELKSEAAARHFYLESRYPFCFNRVGDSEIRQKGRLLLSLETDDSGRKLQALKLESEVMPNGSSSYRSALTRKGARRSYEIQDNLVLDLFRVDQETDSYFQIAEYKSEAKIEALEFNEVKESHTVAFQSWGKFNMEDRGGRMVLKPELSSTLSQRATASGGSSWYDMILSPTKAVGPSVQVSEQVLEECGSSQGSREVRFDFLRDQSRFKNILTYTSNDLEIEDPKGEMKSAKMKRASCIKSKGEPTWFGIPGISWDKLLK